MWAAGLLAAGLLAAGLAVGLAAGLGEVVVFLGCWRLLAGFLGRSHEVHLPACD